MPVFDATADAARGKLLTGGLLLDADLYKVDAGRRVAAGEVELHTCNTDVMYVPDGEATLARVTNSPLTVTICSRERTDRVPATN